LQLIAWFEINEPVISEAVKLSLISWCSSKSIIRSVQFGSDDEFPIIRDERELKQAIGLHGITIHQIEKGGVPYIGYEFGCEWEEKHGLGVLMHGTRLVEIGFTDTALHLWVAVADAESFQ
jgi:hypothetical protein